jgi:hypothetical protein
MRSDDYVLKNILNVNYFVIVNFYIFLENHLNAFFCPLFRRQMDYILASKSAEYFCCNFCDFKCSRGSDWNRHILTAKHKKRTIGVKKEHLENQPKINNFKCDCGKEYKHRQGLWKHQKICSIKNTNIKLISNLTEKNIMDIISQNQEFKQLLIEQNNKILELAAKSNTTINNTTNNTFNLQMFLNVQCKDALNIMDFVNSLELKVKDLENMAKLGYSDGISNIFINGLQDLDIKKRPIHCSDLKRETIYIKDQDTWEKENDERNKLKLAIKTIASKNIKQISLWQKENPGCLDASCKKNDQYLKIVSNAMSGSTIEESQKNYDKIISKVAREVVIQK